MNKSEIIPDNMLFPMWMIFFILPPQDRENVKTAVFVFVAFVSFSQLLRLFRVQVG